jgi:hypothetical protein
MPHCLTLHLVAAATCPQFSHLTTGDSMNLRPDYQKLSDLLAYGELNAPNFPAEDQVDLSRFFNRVLDHYEHILAHETKVRAVQWLNLSRQDVIAARQFFFKQKDNEGVRKLNSAGDYLSNARTRKRIKTAFQIEDAGLTE